MRFILALVFSRDSFARTLVPLHLPPLQSTTDHCRKLGLALKKASYQLPANHSSIYLIKLKPFFSIKFIKYIYNFQYFFTVHFSLFTILSAVLSSFAQFLQAFSSFFLYFCRHVGYLCALLSQFLKNATTSLVTAACPCTLRFFRCYF